MAKATTTTAIAPPPGRKLWLPVFRPQKPKLAHTPTVELTTSTPSATILDSTTVKRPCTIGSESAQVGSRKRARVEDSGFKSATKSSAEVGEQGQGTPTKSTGSDCSLGNDVLFSSPSIESGSSDSDCVSTSPSIESGSSPSSASLRHSSASPLSQLSSSLSPPSSRYALSPAPEFNWPAQAQAKVKLGVKKEPRPGRCQPIARRATRPAAPLRAQAAKSTRAKPAIKLGKCRKAVTTSCLTQADTWDPIDDATLSALDDDEKSSSIPHLQPYEQNLHSAVRVGEVRAIAQAPADEVPILMQEVKPWYGVVKDIRGLVSDKRSGKKRATGNPGASYLNVYVQIAFLYTRADFEMLLKTSPHYRWRDTLPSLGGDERVETDHTMWIRLGRVGERKVPALRFDDRYPAAPVPGTNDAFEPAAHPLAFLNQACSGQTLPDYLFGDEFDSEGEADHRGKAPYVRASFGFADKVVKQEDEEDAAERKPKGAEKARRKTEWTKLSLTAHHNDQPYDPATVQHFSTALQQWCNVADLKSRKQKRKKALVKYDKDDSADANSSAERSDAILSALDSLAGQNIVRGGAFGLTGNAFLVTRAIEVRDKLVQLDGKTDKKSRVKALMVEAEGLVVSAAEWAAEVKRRKAEGVEAGEAPKGEVWVCPSDGKTEI